MTRPGLEPGRAAAVGSQLITAWAIERPMQCTQYKSRTLHVDHKMFVSDNKWTKKFIPEVKDFRQDRFL
jgi:hypothetical protein